MKTRVADLMIAKSVQVKADDKISRVLRKIAEDRETMLACVVDEAGRLVGIITPGKLLRAVQLTAFKDTRDPSLEWAEILSSLTTKYAGDIVETRISVTPDNKVEDAIELMLDKGLYELPVVDKDNRVIGEINFFSIIVNWAKESKRVHGPSMLRDNDHWHSRITFQH